MIDLITNSFGKFGATLVMISVLVTVYWLVRILIYWCSKDLRKRYRYRKRTLYLLALIGLILLFGIWGSDIKKQLTSFAVLGAAFVIGFREHIVNLTAFIVILWRKPLSLGDRIQIGNTCGDVAGIGIMYLTLVEVEHWEGSNQTTGRLIKQPNSAVLTNPVINYTDQASFIWHEIDVIITPQNNWQLAEKILLEIGQHHCQSTVEKATMQLQKIDDEVIIFGVLTPTVYISVVQKKPSGVKLTLRYLCEPRNRRNTERDIWHDILLQFGSNKIAIRFET